MKAMKFRVHSPEHSKAIQEKLFELGYYWTIGSIIPEHLTAKFLFADADNYIAYEYTDEKYFTHNSNTLITLDDLYKLPKNIKFELNKHNTAIIDKSAKVVVVGCQEFSFDKIRELVKLLD